MVIIKVLLGISKEKAQGKWTERGLVCFLDGVVIICVVILIWGCLGFGYSAELKPQALYMLLT